MKYETKEVVKLLDSEVIGCLFRLYSITYENIAVRLRITKQAVTYKMKNDSWKEYEREMVLELLQQHGLELSELIIFHTMIKKKVAK